MRLELLSPIPLQSYSSLVSRPCDVDGNGEWSNCDGGESCSCDVDCKSCNCNGSDWGLSDSDREWGLSSALVMMVHLPVHLSQAVVPLRIVPLHG